MFPTLARFDLTGKVALVAGAGRGLGFLRRSAATGLAQDPLDLAHRNPKDLSDLRDGHAILHPDAYPGNL